MTDGRLKFSGSNMDPVNDKRQSFSHSCWSIILLPGLETEHDACVSAPNVDKFHAKSAWRLADLSPLLVMTAHSPSENSELLQSSFSDLLTLLSLPFSISDPLVSEQVGASASSKLRVHLTSVSLPSRAFTKRCCPRTRASWPARMNASKMSLGTTVTSQSDSGRFSEDIAW